MTRRYLTRVEVEQALGRGAAVEQWLGAANTVEGRIVRWLRIDKERDGRFGVTPEFPGGTYYYVLTNKYPFVPRLLHGVPDDSFKRKGPPGGGRGGPPGRGGQGGGPGGGRPPRPSNP